MIRVAVVDDQKMVRDGLSQILNAQPDMQVVGDAANGKEFLSLVRSDPHLDVALVDIRMPVMDGLSATRDLAAIPDAPAVIVLTTFDEDDAVTDAIAAGAQGFLLKRSTGLEVAEIVRRVAAGDAIVSQELMNAVFEHVRNFGRPSHADIRVHHLSERELEVMALIGLGLTNGEIAARLHLSLSTVKNRVSVVLAKTGSRDRVQAAILAIRAGLT